MIENKLALLELYFTPSQVYCNLLYTSAIFLNCSHIIYPNIQDCYFTTHDPTVHHPKMHDSCINYSNQFKLCRKTINTMQLELYLAERKTGSCCIIQVTVSPYHAEFSGVFLKRIKLNVTLTESQVFIVLRLFT